MNVRSVTERLLIFSSKDLDERKRGKTTSSQKMRRKPSEDLAVGLDGKIDRFESMKSQH